MLKTVGQNLICVFLVITCAPLAAQEIERYPLHSNIAETRSDLEHEVVVQVQADHPTEVKPQFARFSSPIAVETGEIEFRNLPVLLPSKADSDNEIQVVSDVQVDHELSFANTSLQLPSIQAPLQSHSNQQLQDDHGLLAPYHARAETFRDSELQSESESEQQLPAEFKPWWASEVTDAFGFRSRQMSVSLDTLIQSAVQHSPHIQVAAAKPHIQQTRVFEESAKFDWHSFLETKYDEISDPIGNTLTTGNNEDRFNQKEWYGKGGVRRQNQIGGEIEISQRMGYLDSNSRFLIPPDQGSSRLEINYRQPLLKGRGRMVNESVVVLADIDFHSANDDFIKQMQSHLADVTEIYWELVRARAVYLQRKKLLESAKQILAKLEGRAEVDALERQVFRARAAVANRQAEIARSVTSIKNAESRIRLLVNEPMLIEIGGVEYMPTDLPTQMDMPIELADAVSTAIINRPDISKAIRDVRAANVRLGVAKNDVLPKLDLLMGTYAAGLDDHSDAFNSWVNQFKVGRPGFNVGLEFEVPFGNRASVARQQRQQWEVLRTLHQFRAVIETGLTEVEIAVREVKTAHLEMAGRYQAMVASANETNYLVDRWQTLPGIDDSVTLLLEDLLDSQERQADEEAAYAQAQFDYTVAVVKLKQAMGTLFQVQ